MSGPHDETLTAALRRLADEHATGLLSVATAGPDVVIELAAGTPVTIGPVHDVSDRVGSDAGEESTTAVVVDELLDRTVAAVIDGDVEWSWDVASSAERVPLPHGLVQELARRAVDAAQALQTAGADTVLQPGADLETTGELDRVRRLFDGERTVEEVADDAGLALPTVATMAAALVEGGALLAPAPEVDEERIEVEHSAAAGAEQADRAGASAGDWAASDEDAETSWTDTVAAVDEDDEDDEPELWVMGPTEDDESADDASAPEDEPADVASVAEPVRLRAEFDSAPGADEADVEATDDVDADAASAAEWNDTSWLDELALPDGADDELLFDQGDEHDAHATRDALGSMLQDLQSDRPPAASSGEEDKSNDAPQRRPAEPLDRGEPKAEPGDVAEFLRELSRLALDDE